MTDPYPNRPAFSVPLQAGKVARIVTYVGHDPDDKKMDIYQQGTPTGAVIVAAAAGKVHEWFPPGGIEIDHGHGWFTTYLHMTERVPVGTYVAQGDYVGTMGNVDTGAVHLHHEQLYCGNGCTDADTADMVNPIIQGKGPLVLIPGDDHAIFMTSTAGLETASGGSNHEITQPEEDEEDMAKEYVLRDGGGRYWVIRHDLSSRTEVTQPVGDRLLESEEYVNKPGLLDQTSLGNIPIAK